MRNGQFPGINEVGPALQTVSEFSKVTIQLHQAGDIPTQYTDKLLTLRLIPEVFRKFSDLAVPRTFAAVVTRYESPRLGLSSDSSPPRHVSYENAILYASMLMDAFFDFKNLQKRLSRQMSEIKAGVAQFNEPNSLSPSNESHLISAGNLFASSISGLARAKRECALQMMRIINEAKEITRNPDIASDVERDQSFQDPVEFEEKLPKVIPVNLSPLPVCKNTEHPLFYGDQVLLFPTQRKRIEDLLEEHRDIPKHLHLTHPYGSDHGGLFGSIDFLKPDWTLIKTSVTVARGTVSSITLRYTNGLTTIFGSRTCNEKSFCLDLDVQQQEKVISCSVEVGRRGPNPTLPLHVTALRLSTNRGSTLFGQAHDWASPSNGISVRESLKFHDLEMKHYDAPMNNGHIVGFWGRTPIDANAREGLYCVGPVWSNLHATIPRPSFVPETAEEEHIMPSSILPCGIWDTKAIHDFESPMKRTSATLTYDNLHLDEPLPDIMIGFSKTDTWNRAIIRFAGSTKSVTTNSFAIGVDQWSDSKFYT